MAIPKLKPNYTWWNPNVSSIKRSTITTINFADSYTPTSTPTDSWDASVAQDRGIMCYVEGTVLTIAGNGSGKIKANEDSSRFLFTVDGSDSFSKCTAINNLPLLDTSQVTTMNRMFRSCNAATIDLSGLNTSNCVDMYQMFGVCSKMKTQSFAHFDVSKVKDMGYMFYQCTALKTIDFENWDVSNVEVFDHFLSHSRVTKADTSKWNVSKCKNFNAMFNDISLTEVDLSQWDFKSAEIFSQMFDGSASIKKITFPKDINTSNIYCFEQMFNQCQSLEELDLTNFDTRKACCGKPTSSNGSTSGNTGTIFAGCRKLKKITLGRYFTFLGDGTTTNSNYIGTMPTPSSTYIPGADGKWYTLNGNSYSPSEVPNLKYQTYYATLTSAEEEKDNKKYVSYNAIKEYSSLWNEKTEEKLNEAKTYTDGKLDEYVPDYVNTAISGLLSLVDNTVSLPENANLNDYISGADSYYATESICASCSNSPTTLGFRLIVLEGYTSSRTIQILIDGDGDVYQRARTGENWTQWSCINKQYVVATSAPANTNVLWLKPNV